jgi:hypothetical protein
MPAIHRINMHENKEVRDVVVELIPYYEIRKCGENGADNLKTGKITNIFPLTERGF